MTFTSCARAKRQHSGHYFRRSKAADDILDQGYHVVVGNPPYITVKDEAQNEAYRGLYSTCYRQYSLGVPFTQRFWELAAQKGEAGAPANGAGYVGMITANSFMKRECGKKLIEEFLPKQDLTHVIDTSPAHPAIESHGTATVILFGRNQRPVLSTLRSVLGIRSDKNDRGDPTGGRGWKAIVDSVDIVGVQSEFLSVVDTPRPTYAGHPWSIGGGGASDLFESINASGQARLGDKTESIGRTSVVGEDDCWIMEGNRELRLGLSQYCVPFGVGDSLRDWQVIDLPKVTYPYTTIGGSPLDPLPERLHRWLWTFRTLLAERTVFGKSMSDNQRFWYEHLEHYVSKLRTPLSIAFAFVATHNHFVLDRGGKVFNRSAPVITFPENSSEEDLLGLLGLLNSSTACFWLKQVCYSKGAGGINEGVKSEQWEQFREFSAAALGKTPVPDAVPLDIARQLDTLARQHTTLRPATRVHEVQPSAERLSEANTQATAIRCRLVALQEELDWQCYQLYGMLPDDLCYTEPDLPGIQLGQRSFEFVMARQIAKGELETTWFEQHGSKPITELPSHWPAAYRKLVDRRIKIIETNKEIALIEKPEYKRRWNTEPWEEQEQRALRNWLLDRLESTPYWPDPNKKAPALQTTAQLADKASADHDFMQVAALYRGRPGFDVAALVAELVTSEAVPFLPILRYKPSGLRKRAVWEQTWDLQRKQDAGEDVGDIPVPPKYTTADFQKNDYWRLRGKLDVPKERWISYSHCSTDADPTLLVGWAGWDHLQQATALVHYYDARKRDGWDAKRLTPLLAGLDQLLPWIHQWHPAIDKEFGETAGQSFQTMLEHDAHELGLTLEDIRNWQPPKTATRQRRARK